MTAPALVAAILLPAAWVLAAFAADVAGPGGHPIYAGLAISLSALLLGSRATRRSAGYTPL